MNNKAMTATCFALLLSVIALPASAQARQVETVGPQGGQTVRESTITPSENGGYTINRNGSAVGPAGNSTEWSGERNVSYDSETGFEGDRTTTVNGNTYERTTKDGVTTVIGANGGTRVYTRPRAR
ncbi:MAG: hypothetical protein AAGC93_11150 [Cyanobacteria bacterium P01_F01_bin.53]